MNASTDATLLATWLEIVAPWRDVFPQARSYRRAVRQALGSLACLVGGVCRVSSGPSVVRRTVGVPSTFSTPGVSGTPKRCFTPFLPARCPCVAAVWSASPSTIRDCIRRDGVSRRPRSTATRGRRPFT